MIKLKDILNLKNNDGMTLNRGKKQTYKSGFQVAIEGIETVNVEEALRAIKEYEETCGVWYSDGVYYIDKSIKVDDEKEALEIARNHKQISILNWSNMSLIYC